MKMRIQPVSGLPEGYNAWDYIPGLCSLDRFDSWIEGMRAIEEHYLGADCDGVNAYFDVVPVDDAQ